MYEENDDSVSFKARYADVDGIPMRWLEQGQGTPVVLIHGIPTSPALWRDVAPRLTGVRVLMWEMVGYGQSIPQGENRDISVARQADYLRAWLHELDLGSAVLVGHDLGGGVAHIAAVGDPSICAGLVLTNAIGYDSWPIPSVKMMRAMGPLTAHLPLALLKANLGMLMMRGHDDRSIARESLDIHFQAYAEHGGGAALLRQMEALDTQDTLAIADQIATLSDKPARVVWGAADPFQKLEYGERFARDLDCTLVPIEGGKHFVPEDHPDILAREIMAVVADAFPAGARLDIQAEQNRPRGPTTG